VRRPLALLALLALTPATTAVVPSAAAAKTRPRVTLIGDSVAASLNYVPAAVRRLGAGLDLRVDAKVCRRLVAPSCAYQGTAPPTALETIQRAGASLGHTVVINVGYNDAGQFYGRDLDRVMRALRAAKVRSVIWVTLPLSRSVYGTIDYAIRAAARRWHNLSVADWAAASRGRPWFAGDGLHLNATGAMGLAQMLRPLVVSAVRAGAKA
jgi:lysophospholipase L1-like esterase